MEYSKPHTLLAQYCMKHVLKELIPFASLEDEYQDGATFTLVFHVKEPINSSFVPHLEGRMRDLGKHVSVKEMLESNARDYLLAQGEKKQAHRLSPNGRRLVSLVSLFGTYQVLLDEVAQELWPVKILRFEEKQGKWYLVAATLPDSFKLDQFASLYARIGHRRYVRRGVKERYFEYSGKGTTWLEQGIDAKERLRKMVREWYREIGCIEKVYPGQAQREIGVFHLEEKVDELFPSSPCYGDVGYILYDDKSLETISQKVKFFFIENGFEVVEKKDHSFSVKDIFGTLFSVCSIKKETAKEGPLARINLFYSLERWCSLLLEKE